MVIETAEGIFVIRARRGEGIEMVAEMFGGRPLGDFSTRLEADLFVDKYQHDPKP